MQYCNETLKLRMVSLETEISLIGNSRYNIESTAT